MWLRVGRGGWHLVEGDDLGIPGRVYFRIQDVGGHRRITELYIDGRGDSLTASSVRDLPVQALEQWSLSLGLESTGVGPDLSTLASYFNTGFGPQVKHWVAESMHAQLRSEDDPTRVPYAKDPGGKPQGLPPLTLDPPPDGRITDEFLADVARAYQAAIARGMSPAKPLAKMAHTSEKSVHRWVARARDKGYLPPAERTGRIV